MKVKPEADEMVADLGQLLQQSSISEHTGCSCCSSSLSSSDSTSSSSSSPIPPHDVAAAAAGAQQLSRYKHPNIEIPPATDGSDAASSPADDQPASEMLRELRDIMAKELAAKERLTERLTSARIRLTAARVRLAGRGHARNVGPAKRRFVSAKANKNEADALRQQLAVAKRALAQRPVTPEALRQQLGIAERALARQQISMQSAVESASDVRAERDALTAKLTECKRKMDADNAHWRDFSKKLQHKMQTAVCKVLCCVETADQLALHRVRNAELQQQLAALQSTDGDCKRSRCVSTAEQLKKQQTLVAELSKKLSSSEQLREPMLEIVNESEHIRRALLHMQHELVMTLMPYQRQWRIDGVPRHPRFRYINTCCGGMVVVDPIFEHLMRVQMEVQHITARMVHTNQMRRNRLRNMYRQVNKMDDGLMALPGVQAVWEAESESWVSPVKRFMEYTEFVRYHGQMPQPKNKKKKNKNKAGMLQLPAPLPLHQPKQPQQQPQAQQKPQTQPQPKAQQKPQTQPQPKAQPKVEQKPLAQSLPKQQQTQPKVNGPAAIQAAPTK